MPTKPWIEGSLELLNHGLEHLQSGEYFDARIAMISIDNAVELMIKTYLGLPSRISGINGLSRRNYEELCKSFPGLLDGIEVYAPDKIVGIELGDIEWFHRLRNQLYHEGNGITVEKGKVEGYAEIGKILFSNLFGVEAQNLIIDAPKTMVGEFFSLWATLEQKLIPLRRRYDSDPGRKNIPVSFLIKELVKDGILKKSFQEEFDSIRVFRNELAHGFATPSASDLRTHISTIKELLKIIDSL